MNLARPSQGSDRRDCLTLSWVALPLGHEALGLGDLVGGRLLRDGVGLTQELWDLIPGLKIQRDFNKTLKLREEKSWRSQSHCKNT